MAKLRVLHVQRGLPFHEGSSTYVLTLLKHLPRDRFDVLLALLTKPQWGPAPLGAEAEAAGIKVHTIEARERFSMQSLTQLLGVLRKERVDLVHIHGYKSLATALPAAKFQRLPIVASTHGWTKASAKAIAYESLERGLLRHCQLITVGSEALRADLIARGFGEGDVRVVYNAVDVEAFSAPGSDRAAVRKELKIDESARLVGAVGRLSREKGHRHLIAAMADLIPLRPDVKVVIVGEGTERKALENLAWQYGVTRNLLMLETWEDMAALYHSLDLLVLPSLAESLPMVILEAAASGVPVIATDVGGVGEVIADGQTGLLVGPGDPGDLAQKILWALDHRDEMLAYAHEAKAVVREKFNAESMARAMGAVYDEAVAIAASNAASSAAKADRG
ncbi:MAG: glycosyltransferase family 4 protein [Myxococcales bacterium]|nr:glycosyltransferase family 4 protein [Myxococcales bacterium]